MSRALTLLFGLILLLLMVPAAEGQLNRRQYLPFIARESTPTASPTPVAPVQFRYRAWAATLGWQEWQQTSAIKDQGGIAGTVGQSRPIEAIQFELLNAPPGANIKYRVHVAFQGWLDWANNGSVAGKEGSGQQIEAIQVALENVPNTSVSTQVMVATWGWLPYVRDFWVAGTTHQGRRVEAFRTYVRTGSPEPAQVGVAYSVKQQDLEWTDWIRNGETAGRTGEQRRIEAMRVMLYNKPFEMDVEYIVNIEGLSWGAWVHDADIAGDPNGVRSIFAFQMRLIGAYDGSHVNYQGHFQDKGWLGPVTEGALGNPDDPNDRKRLEAIRVFITHDKP